MLLDLEPPRPLEAWERVLVARDPIELTSSQLQAVTADNPVVGYVGGYGSGKTVALVMRCIRLLRMDRCPVLIGAPTFDLIDLVIMPELEKWLDIVGMRYKVNRAKHTVNVFGYATIILRSLETPGRIVGFSVGHALLDELDILTHSDAMEAYRKCLARCRLPLPQQRVNTVALFTTPEGFKAAYELLVIKPAPGTLLIPAPTYSNPWLTAGYVDSLRANYPPQLIDAYIEGRFVNMVAGNVYPMFDRRLNATSQVVQPGPLHIGMDFNVANMSALIHQPGTDCRWAAVAELVKIRDTPSMIGAIRERYGATRAVHVYPDATGEKRATTNATLTDLSLLVAAEFHVHADASNPRVRDRVNSVNAAFCNAEGSRRYRLNIAACPAAVRAFETQAWDDSGMPDKPGGFDDQSHIVDAAGYFVHRVMPAARPVSRAVAERPKVRAAA